MLLIYTILLRNRPIHAFNRVYLLTTAVVPVILPFISVSQQAGATINSMYNTGLQIPEIIVRPGDNDLLSFNDFTVLVYVGVCTVLLTIAVLKLYRLKQAIRKAEAEQGNGYTLLKNSGFGPGSWMRYIFLPDEDANDMVIQHEKTHIQLGHTYDVLLLQFLHVIFWPNMLLTLVRKELRSIHEFQADAAVTGEKQTYAQLLVASVFNSCTLPYTHSFHIHPIKRRISMLNKKVRFTSALSGVIAIATTVFVATGIIGIQSCQNKKWEVKKETSSMHEQNKQDDGVHVMSEQMPEFNGDLAAFISDNLVYPEEAKKKNIQGKVYVSFTVDDQGNIKDAEAIESKEKADPILVKAALDVVSKMPRWKPGKDKGETVCVRQMLPISFKLD
jgi:TonB family protein